MFTVDDAEFALIIGEALIDIVQTFGDPDNPQAHPGGSPMNVALTLGRLGHPVQMVTQLAEDDYGRMVLDHLSESSVPLAPGSFSLSHTSTALAKLDEQGAATYVFDLTWDLPSALDVPPGAAFVHTGSIAATLLPGARAVLETLRRAKATALLTYDPNIRPSIIDGREATVPFVEEYVRTVDLIKVSDEDLEWLYPGKPLEEIVEHWFELGNVQIIVVTQGSEGPAAWSRQGDRVASKPEPVAVVDTVGAGDSFMGALIDALWRRGLTHRKGADRLGSLDADEISAILDEANQVATVTVSRAGANPPWANELGR